MKRSKIIARVVAVGSSLVALLLAGGAGFSRGF